MKGENLLKHALHIMESRRAEYGDSSKMFKEVAARWSLTLGVEVSPAAVVLCLIDLKLSRLCHDVRHTDSVTDIAGYAAVLAEITQGDAYGR
jgi:hypothetical protein